MFFYIDDDALDHVRMPFRRKILVRAAGGGLRVYMDSQARPFNELAPGDLLDIADLSRLFRCSSRTVYRWIAGHSLRPAHMVGRVYLFTKREISRWYNANRPRPGRPPLNRR
jgi:excisionase family DNA binding protein